MNGPSISRSAASTTGMLTAFVTRPPSSAATTCSATIRPARSCASSVEAARCGVTTTSSSSSSGPVYGSVEKTSSAAPASFPERIASTSASSSTSAPRAALIKPRAVPHLRDRLRPMIPVVSSVSGRWSVTKSAAPSTLVQRRRRARCRPRGSGPRRRTGRSRRPACPSPTARRATCWPIRPKPRTPSVLSASSIPPQRERSQAALFQRGMGLRDVAREGDQQADRLLRGRDDGRVGRVRDDDPAVGRRIDVDVVDPDAGPADHLQPAGALDQVGGQLGRRADDDRVVVADRLREIGVAVDVDVEVLAEELDARLGDRLADEDPRPLRALARIRPARRRVRLERARSPPSPRSMSAPASHQQRARRAASAVVMSKTS